MDQQHINRMEKKGSTTEEDKSDGQELMEDAHEQAQEVADRLEEASRPKPPSKPDAEITINVNTSKED